MNVLRHGRRHALIASAGLLFTLASPVTQAAAVVTAPRYQYIDLQVSQGPRISDPGGINAAGNVVGDVTQVGLSATKGFIASTERHRAMFVLDGDNTRFYAINDAGTVVGYGNVAGDAEGQIHAVRGRNGSPGSFTRLLPPDQDGSSIATAVSSDGRIAGWSRAPGSRHSHGFVWHHGKVKQLPLLDGANSYAQGVNSAGVVVGFAHLTAFTWQDGSMTALPTLGGASAQALAINDAGLIVGQAADPDGLLHAVAWQGGVPQALPTGSAGPDAARAVNADGVIVGHAATATLPGTGYDTLGWVWVNGQGWDLNTVTDGLPAGAVIADAAGINAQGQIAVSVMVGSKLRAALLTPVDSARVSGR